MHWSLLKNGIKLRVCDFPNLVENIICIDRLAAASRETAHVRFTLFMYFASMHVCHGTVCLVIQFCPILARYSAHACQLPFRASFHNAFALVNMTGSLFIDSRGQ